MNSVSGRAPTLILFAFVVVVVLGLVLWILNWRRRSAGQPVATPEPADVTPATPAVVAGDVVIEDATTVKEPPAEEPAAEPAAEPAPSGTTKEPEAPKEPAVPAEPAGGAPEPVATEPDVAESAGGTPDVAEPVATESGMAESGAEQSTGGAAESGGPAVEEPVTAPVVAEESTVAGGSTADDQTAEEPAPEPASAESTATKSTATGPTATESTAAESTVAEPVGTEPAGAPTAAAAPDLAEGARVLGVRVKQDDLKLIGGIGPKLESLLHAAGITTWQALADSDVDTLRGILTTAGTRYRAHDPGSWPTEAALLAAGRWAEFKALRQR